LGTANELLGEDNMKNLPKTKNALVLRVDFSDEAAWESIRTAILEPVGEFRAYVEFVSDPAFSGIGVHDLLTLQAESSYRSFMFVVDQMALTHPDHPILVLDLLSEPGRTFRVVPSEMWGVENNLSLANMDFAEFADSVDPDGIFRGFPEG
jgi:Domain of unknown function (DUF6924)